MAKIAQTYVNQHLSEDDIREHFEAILADKRTERTVYVCYAKAGQMSLTRRDVPSKLVGPTLYDYGYDLADNGVLLFATYLFTPEDDNCLVECFMIDGRVKAIKTSPKGLIEAELSDGCRKLLPRLVEGFMTRYRVKNPRRKPDVVKNRAGSRLILPGDPRFNTNPSGDGSPKIITP